MVQAGYSTCVPGQNACSFPLDMSGGPFGDKTLRVLSSIPDLLLDQRNASHL